ncbi:uncharacterized protein LOC143305731 [Osmia lignaria lignaria]|uniref:uncharacterized protein LOC143305731 n=1 Tax=Osmia lignaria lignaria TaxID=1437193 RepID=UPI00402B6E2C
MRFMDNGIATILVLCEKRTVTLYIAIFNLILKLPNNINFIMSDYEIAAVKAVCKFFPNAHIHGCWFHYCQTVLRKWRKFGLTNAPNIVVRMTMSLPLLPEMKFQEGLLIIQREADIISNNFPNVLLFMAYMRTNWLKMASRVSVHNCPVRTNNIAKSFHNIAALKLGKQNINVWTFLEKIRDLLIDQELDFNRLQNGIACRRPRTYGNINCRKKIIKAQAEYDTERLTLEEFLRIFNYEDTIFQSNKIDTVAIILLKRLIVQWKKNGCIGEEVEEPYLIRLRYRRIPRKPKTGKHQNAEKRNYRFLHILQVKSRTKLETSIFSAQTQMLVNIQAIP